MGLGQNNNGFISSSNVLGSQNFNPMQALGDMIVQGEHGATRLPVGSEGQVLTIVSGVPAWLDSLANVATKLQKEFILDENMAALRAVVLTNNTNISLADKDTLPNARGVVVSSGLAGETRPVVMFGIMESASFLWPLDALLFLGDNGVITDTAPSAVGEHRVVIGRSLGAGAIFVEIGEPEKIL